MTTITFKEDISIKTNFVNIKDLYEYIIENQLLTEVWELSQDEINDSMKKNLEKAKMLDDNMFVNLK